MVRLTLQYYIELNRIGFGIQLKLGSSDWSIANFIYYESFLLQGRNSRGLEHDDDALNS